VVRALDERLLEAAAPEPAETEVEDDTGLVELDDGGEWEGKEEGDGVGQSEAQDQRKSRRRQQQEEDAATAERDRFKLINGKEVPGSVQFTCSRITNCPANTVTKWAFCDSPEATYSD
jgi:hypothetical protein